MPSKAELQQYIHKYKLEAQDDANNEMERLFDKSNQIEQKLGADLIVFASVMLTIMGGFIAASDLSLSSTVKIVLTIGVVALLLSILAGLANYRSMSKFWLKWARAKHDRGGIIERDKAKTYKDLEKLRKTIMDLEAALPKTSPKLFSRM